MIPAMPESELPAGLDPTSVHTIFADLELALAFTKLAQTAGSAATRNCNWAYARDAFFTIRDHLLPLCTLTDSQRTEVNGKLNELRRRLRHRGPI